MDLLKAIKDRRSVHRFLEKIPAKELLFELIEYAVMAPNAMNRQDWRFTIIRSHKVKQQISSVVEKKWSQSGDGESGIDDPIKTYAGNFISFVSAPVLIMVDIKKPPRFLIKRYDENAAKITGSYASACMAVQNLLLASHDKGLGTCVYSGFLAAENEVKQILNISDKRELVCLIALGYPDENPLPPGRNDIQHILTIID
ncbi:MAG: nitroreductase family protein [Proteobacteria bacterium]|nr:nitroreductase family protein [Pseudomonadota bacterium]